MSLRTKHRPTRNFLTFLKYFFRYVTYVRDVILGLVFLMLIGAIAISHFENMRLGDAIYFACVTGLSVGYGDIVPVTPAGRILSVAIGMIGLVFTGLVIAVATRALTEATAENLENANTSGDSK